MGTFGAGTVGGLGTISATTSEQALEVLDFLVVFAGKGFDLVGGNVAEHAAKEFLFEEVVLAGESGEFLGDGIGERVGGALLLLEDARGEEGLGFPRPGHEGWFGDAKAAGDGGKAQALSAELEELCVGGGGVHGNAQGGGGGG
jgi:hypothetical protein